MDAEDRSRYRALLFVSGATGMICPSCGFVNVPGADECTRCLFALAQLDLPVGQDPVERSVMNDTVGSIQPKAPVTISQHDTLGSALNRMVDHRVGALLVVDAAGGLVGILTERDYLRKVIGLVDDPMRRTVAEFMTERPESVGSNDRLAFALHKMDVGGYRHLPVVDSAGHPVGIISVRDVIRHLTRLIVSA